MIKLFKDNFIWQRVVLVFPYQGHSGLYSVVILKAIDRVRNKRYNSIKIVTLFGLSELFLAEKIDFLVFLFYSIDILAAPLVLSCIFDKKDSGDLCFLEKVEKNTLK